MYYRDDVISYLQSNKILALKLDHALTAVREMVIDQVKTIGMGATRALYYTSCFTDEYQDVCQQQKTEDFRFGFGVINLLQHGDVVYNMVRIYFEEIFKHKTSEQLERIKELLMAVNVHIAASSLTKAGFAIATATSVCVGMNLNLEMRALTASRSGRGTVLATAYGIVQKAADSARRLQVLYPVYYSALYMQELEMMYFLIEPLFERAGALEAEWASDYGIANIITRMIR
ncbi:hypothetical protein [Yokenella regensburgei]|uniref:hypothetical protein n=1 Tax=Yokenella regensburgei TaxID=158877 RepID=UPI0020772FB9|nr:hypothetical protein [Yokenella regensburgei]